MFDLKHPARWRRMIGKKPASASETKKARRNRAASGAGGQAMVEYALIAVLVILGLVTILTVTAPAIGNVFSNTVYNLLGQQFTPYSTLAPAEKANLATAVGSYTPNPVTYYTNTPLAPTCQSNPNIWATPTNNADGSITFAPSC
ncbi:MAG: hypothetical protein IT324_05790 [Anaerolineae bacterium]|nr:hypothetical protein [Anaerolineae bacterium]